MSSAINHPKKESLRGHIVNQDIVRVKDVSRETLKALSRLGAFHVERPD